VTALHELTALDQWHLMRSGELTPGELVAHYLERIDRLNAQLGALTVVAADRAREAAEKLPDTVSTAAPLWGLPVADKELTARVGQRTTYGSRLFADNVPIESDELARHLDAAGAISLGASAAPEFGLPSYTESRVAPPARTPYALDRGAGGSSGGAAAAVAGGLVPFAPGSDGGGSIRIPAAACGIVGLKPSRGRVPASSGLASLAGLVVAGPLARTVADAALLLDALVSATPWPFATRAAGPEDAGPFLAHAVRGEGRFQVGVLTDSPWQLDYELTIAPEAQHALDRAIGHLDAMGHGVDAIDLGPSDDWAGYPEAFRAVWMASAASIPAETDAELALLEPLTAWLVARGRELPARRLAAALVWLSGFERRLIERFSSVDVVITPALALTPRPIGWYDAEDAEHNFAQQVQYTPWTSMINVAGLPAITIPMGVSRESDGELSDRPGMPMGVQLIGRPGGEATLLALAAQLERRARLPHTPVLE